LLDRHLLPLQRRFCEPPARALVAAGVSADAITLAGFAVGLGAVAAIASGAYGFGLALILANRAFDGLDGAVARRAGATDRGAYLDIALDFAFYALVPAAFAWADPVANALAASVLIASFMATGSAFLAFATVAAKRGLAGDAYPDKGIYYLGGLAEGAETILFFVACCLWPASFATFAWIFATLCALTAVGRWAAGWRSFGPRDQ
jgi:phosphatidylglycerophosphate synthase